MTWPITVHIQIQTRIDGPIEDIPVHGIDAATLANAAFVAGVYYKTDHPGFEIVGVGDTT
jgi:hypothetical protein